MPVSHCHQKGTKPENEERPAIKIIGVEENGEMEEKENSSKSLTSSRFQTTDLYLPLQNTCPFGNDTGAKNILDEYGPKFKCLKVNDQIKELQTTLRDRETTRSDFIFYADRLIRLVVEEGLNQLPFNECVVTTPTGAQYHGLQFKKGICGVSIVRCGEAMEKGLRECCRSIRIGKVLIKSDEESNKPKVCYARFPPDIHERKVLLMYPLLNTGATVISAVDLLLESGVPEKNIILITLFATPVAVSRVVTRYPDMVILTTEIHHDCPTHFGRKYFGTE